MFRINDDDDDDDDFVVNCLVSYATPSETHKACRGTVDRFLDVNNGNEIRSADAVIAATCMVWKGSP